MSAPFTVFISYSHHDKKWMERLSRQLRVLEEEEILDSWTDEEIGFGEWERQIKQAMDGADVGVLLVSSHSLTSDFILRKEVVTLLDRAKSGGLTFIPIIVGPCPWQEVTWLSAMQCRPENGRALSLFQTDASADQALVDIAREIAALARLSRSTTGKSEGTGVTEKPSSGARPTTEDDGEPPSTSHDDLEPAASGVTANLGRWFKGLAVAVLAIAMVSVIGYTIYLESLPMERKVDRILDEPKALMRDLEQGKLPFKESLMRLTTALESAREKIDRLQPNELEKRSIYGDLAVLHRKLAQEAQRRGASAVAETNNRIARELAPARPPPPSD